MHKQYFVALYLLVTVATSSGMELSKSGMEFSDEWWEILIYGVFYSCEEELSRKQKLALSANWETIRYANQTTKDEAVRKLFSEYTKRPHVAGWSNWLTSFNNALDAGANLKNATIPEDILKHVSDPKIAARLIQHGAKINIHTSTGGNLLHQIAADIHLGSELVQLYLDNQVDPDAQDMHGNTPLHALVREDAQTGSYAKADLLIKTPRGKSILMPNGNGVTPLELAYMHMFKKMGNNNPREHYIVYEILKDKMEARVREESYPQDIGDKDRDYITQHRACRERIEQLKEKQKETPNNNSARGIMNYILGSAGSSNGHDKKVD